MIRSYGIILFHRWKGGIKYLCAQRRDQIAYVTFFRNQMEPQDLKYYFSLMSQGERERILKYSIDELLDDLAVTDHVRAPSRFTQGRSPLRDYLNQMKESGKLAQLIADTKSEIKENEWGFPKGRKKYYDEEPLYCALREFYEETQIPLNRLSVLDFPPLIENYTGTDGRHYQSVYFIAEASELISIRYRSLPGKIRTYTISEEISDLLWRSLPETREKLSLVKVKLLEFLESYLQSKTQPNRYLNKPFVKMH